VNLVSSSPEETAEIGQRLGRMLRQGDIVGLYGDLGSGKTTLVKGIAAAFGLSPRDVASASFTVIAAYPTSPPFLHVDLYRIEREADLEGTGIWDCIGQGSVSVIEWAERMGGQTPEGMIRVTISDLGDDKREITVSGAGEEREPNMVKKSAGEA
jgi:tRNA threonylcarbamoyladenosine biosynthesis protein TsaE